MHTAGKANIRGRIDGCKEALSDLVSRGHSSRIVTSGVYFCIGLCCDLRFSHLLSMLFKTLSPSVYGIDAYLVEVEVDVGSARMTDFNVGGVSLSRRSGAISWNPRSLFGLLKSLEAQNKISDADWVRREFEAAWKNADVTLELRDL
jgi:hypothetical protein